MRGRPVVGRVCIGTEAAGGTSTGSTMRWATGFKNDGFFLRETFAMSFENTKRFTISACLFLYLFEHILSLFCVDKVCVLCGYLHSGSRATHKPIHLV